jgi:hypothetical protein
MKHTGARDVQSYLLEMGISRDVASRAHGQGSKGEAIAQHCVMNCRRLIR